MPVQGWFWQIWRNPVRIHRLPFDDRPPLYKPIDVEPRKKVATTFIVCFTEDKKGFSSMAARCAGKQADDKRSRVYL